MRNRFHMTKKNQQIAVNFIQILQEKYPTTFPCKPNPKVALMIGMSKQLSEIAEELEVDKKTIGRAMKLWCTGWRYYTALSVAGEPRFDLYGNVKGLITEVEAQKAKKRLKL